MACYGATRGKSQTVVAFTTLFGSVAAVPVTSSLVSGTRDSLFKLIRDVRHERQLRLFQIDADVPGWLWAVLISCSAILVLLLMASGVGDHFAQALLVGVFAAFLATILVTIHLFDYPFEGSIRIPSDTIINTINHINDIPILSATTEASP